MAGREGVGLDIDMGAQVLVLWVLTLQALHGERVGYVQLVKGILERGGSSGKHGRYI